jgi:hypothetical protein
MGTIALNEKQPHEAAILTRLAAGALDAGTAGQVLGVGESQLRRKLARFRAEGRVAAHFAAPLRWGRPGLHPKLGETRRLAGNWPSNQVEAMGRGGWRKVVI